MPSGKRQVRFDEFARGGWHALSTDLWYWHDGIKNLRQFVPFGQNDWAKEDAAGTSTIDNPYDSGTGRVSVRITPSVAGTHRVRKRILLPRDFGIFASSSPITVVTQRSGADTAFTVTLLDGTTVDPGINAVSVDPSVAATWQAFTLTPTGTYNAGDFLTILFEYQCALAGRTVQVADLSMSYKTNRGNV